MLELTIILFLMTIGLYVLSLIVKNDGIYWIAMFSAICSICQTLTDESVLDVEGLMIIVLAFYVMLMSGLSAFVKKRA